MELIVSNNGKSVKLAWEDGTYSVHPIGTLIAVADTSDRISFKLTGSRKTVYSVYFGDISPSRSDAAETVEALNEIL